ncbi:MAG: hypothetical protein RLZZ230_110 [Candidatus Parcubacteria bacterium]|jgi:peptide/nickel transport system substrate-binding protein
METHSGSSARLLDRFLSLIEVTHGSSDRLILRLALFAVVGTAIWLLFSLNQHYSAVTPTRGGSISEGIVGTPRFVNPALAATRADQDVTALVYSGLMKIMPDGTLANDVAESITVSDDGLTYNIVLRKDVSFHDNTPLTAHDVVYTIQLIQDANLKSPIRGNWTDVTIQEIGEYELNVILEEAYAPFIENFTLGIMPAHAWSSLPIEQLPFSALNTEPIGSGPFAITSAKRDTSGLINHYTLQAFHNNGYDPKIDQFELAFFQNEDSLMTALMNKTIDSTTYAPPEQIQAVLDTGKYQLVEEPLPRTFGIFFNQNRSVALRDKSVREALTVAINRDELIETALHGYGVPINEPTAFLSTELESKDAIQNIATSSLDQAATILEAGGWSKNDLGYWEKEIDKETVTLSITLKTGNAPLFESLVSNISAQWKELGVEVTTEQFEQTGLVQSVIRPRDFEALLFGLDMSRSYELYPFWHSSQQNDPGLNIAQYANVEVDNLLQKARSEQLVPTRIALLQAASEIIVKERPAIFLFQPTLTYLVSNDMTIPDIHSLGRPADRFSNITQWHTEKDSLWPMFRDNI